jgi:glycosyltransferase involved in cell wall biosynthesis
MSLGVPCIVSDFGGNPDMIDEESGIIFPARDAGALADAILSLKENPHRLDSLSAGARTRYLSHFTPDRMAEEYTDVYESLVRRERG